MSTPTALVYTVINSKLKALTPKAFAIANEIRASKNIPLLQPLSHDEAMNYAAENEADTTPIGSIPPPDEVPLLDARSLLNIAVTLAFMILLVLAFFLVTLYRAESFDFAALMHWMGQYRAVMIPIECFGALLWGILS